MARIVGLLTWAIAYAKDGLTATRLYKDLKEMGIAPRQSELYALFKYARKISAEAGEEPFKDIHSVPSGSELTPWPTNNGSGVSQRVQLVYRSRATGTLFHTYYTAASATGITREAAIALAKEKYNTNNDQYETDLVGAVHVGAYQQVPFRAS